MPAANRYHDQALKRATLAAFIEAADALPGLGPVLAGLGTFYREMAEATRDLPDEARDVVQAMVNDFQTLLAQEDPRHAGQTVAVALLETFTILAEHGLTDEALATEAGLDATQAAHRTLNQAADRLRLLEADTEALVRRLVGEYYRVLLCHRDALSHVGVPALQALLRRTAGLEQGVRDLLEAERARAWCNVRWPVRDYDPAHGRHPAMVRTGYRIVPYGGERHRQTLADLLSWARGLAEWESGHRLGLCLYVGPGVSASSSTGPYSYSTACSGASTA